MPLNTSGGQLSGGRLHGFGLIHEACVQLRGEGGERQIGAARWPRTRGGRRRQRRWADRRHHVADERPDLLTTSIFWLAWPAVCWDGWDGLALPCNVPTGPRERTGQSSVWELNVQLEDVEPAIWRDLLVPGTEQLSGTDLRCASPLCPVEGRMLAGKIANLALTKRAPLEVSKRIERAVLKLLLE